MHVLMVSDVFFPRVNGVSTSIRTFSGALAEAGHAVTLIAPEYPGAAPDPEPVLRVPSRYLWLDPEDRMMRASAVRRLLPMLRERAPDIVHVQTPFVAHHTGVRLARALDLPVVASYHTYFEEYLHHYAPFLPRGLCRAVARAVSRRQAGQVDGLVVPTHAMLQVLRGYGVEARAAVIPTGVDARGFQDPDGDRFRRRHGISPGRPVLAYVGRIAHEKNVDFLLHAVARVRRAVPGVLLVVAGEGPAEAHLHRLVARLGIERNVLMVGYLDRTRELGDCYRAARALVFASRTETQGLVLLEAMSLGVPVVSTAVLGTAEVLAARRGALVPEDDLEDFAEAAARILGDDALHRRLSVEALDYARSWSVPVLGERLVEFYATVCRARHARGGEPAGRPQTDP